MSVQYLTTYLYLAFGVHLEGVPLRGQGEGLFWSSSSSDTITVGPSELPTPSVTNTFVHMNTHNFQNIIMWEIVNETVWSETQLTNL